MSTAGGAIESVGGGATGAGPVGSVAAASWMPSPRAGLGGRGDGVGPSPAAAGSRPREARSLDAGARGGPPAPGRCPASVSGSRRPSSVLCPTLPRAVLRSRPRRRGGSGGPACSPCSRGSRCRCAGASGGCVREPATGSMADADVEAGFVSAVDPVPRAANCCAETKTTGAERPAATTAAPRAVLGRRKPSLACSLSVRRGWDGVCHDGRSPVPASSSDLDSTNQTPSRPTFLGRAGLSPGPGRRLRPARPSQSTPRSGRSGPIRTVSFSFEKLE